MTCFSRSYTITLFERIISAKKCMSMYGYKYNCACIYCSKGFKTIYEMFTSQNNAGFWSRFRFHPTVTPLIVLLCICSTSLLVIKLNWTRTHYICKVPCWLLTSRAWTYFQSEEVIMRIHPHWSRILETELDNRKYFINSASTGSTSCPSLRSSSRNIRLINN